MSEDTEAPEESEETPGIVETIKNAVGLGETGPEVAAAADPVAIDESYAAGARRRYRRQADLAANRKRKVLLGR